MKHLIVILAAMLMPMVLFGQQKLIENASRNVPKGQWRKIHNASVFLLDNELQSYCEQNDYYLKGVKGKMVSAYPVFTEFITDFEILPKDEVDLYVYTYKCDFSFKPSFYALSGTGKGWIFTSNGGELFDDIRWSGTVQNGLINGEGTGYLRKDNSCYFISGEFVDGFPTGQVQFGVFAFFCDECNARVDIFTFGEMSDGMAGVKRSNDSKYGFVNSNGKFVVTDKYERVIKPFRNGQAEVVSGGKEIIIDKYCNFIDYTERQKTKDEEARLALEEAERARQQRIQDSLDRVRQRIQDSLDRIERARVEEERRRAEHERKITVNCNYKLWSKGDHICYVFPNGSYKDKIRYIGHFAG